MCLSSKYTPFHDAPSQIQGGYSSSQLLVQINASSLVPHAIFTIIERTDSTHWRLRDIYKRRERETERLSFCSLRTRQANIYEYISVHDE